MSPALLALLCLAVAALCRARLLPAVGPVVTVAGDPTLLLPVDAPLLPDRPRRAGALPTVADARPPLAGALPHLVAASGAPLLRMGRTLDEAGLEGAADSVALLAQEDASGPDRPPSAATCATTVAGQSAAPAPIMCAAGVAAAGVHLPGAVATHATAA